MPTSVSGFFSYVGCNGEVERIGKAARAAAKVGKALKGPFFKLPAGVVPLCNNSRRSEIIAMMPDCNAHGPVPSWKEPMDADVQQFFVTPQKFGLVLMN